MSDADSPTISETMSLSVMRPWISPNSSMTMAMCSRRRLNFCSWLINGSANIREINHDLGWELPTDISVTLNGLILEKICDEPRAGMVTEINGYKIRITRTGKAVIEEAAVCAPEQQPQD